MSEPLYPPRDPLALERAGGYYMRHVRGMTAEKLHGKAEIAEQLAWRDAEIDRLRAELREVRGHESATWRALWLMIRWGTENGKHVLSRHLLASTDWSRAVMTTYQHAPTGDTIIEAGIAPEPVEVDA